MSTIKKNRSKKNFPKVLVVDGSSISRNSIGNMLQDTYRVFFATKSSEVLKKLEKHPDIQIVVLDAVLKDIPRDAMDTTYGVIREIRKKYKDSIKMIAMSHNEDERINQLACGCQRAIKKLKLDLPEILEEVVAQLINEKSEKENRIPKKPSK